MNKDLLYWIPAGQYGKEGVLSLLAQHPEIRFVSLIGIDLAGNDTDEKIPIEIFMKDYDDFFAGKAVQTDGSSVVFMNIATLNDARVDFVADSTVNWYVDYNDENVDDAVQTEKAFEVNDLLKRGLDDAEYLLFSLLYLLEWPRDRIARELNVSPAALKKRIFRLQKKIRRLWQDNLC